MLCREKAEMNEFHLALPKKPWEFAVERGPSKALHGVARMPIELLRLAQRYDLRRDILI